jgi:maltose alpha-D-glucosyltransferase/alpha-amylase
MEYTWRNNSVLCIHNLAAEPREVRFSLTTKIESDRALLINLLAGEHSKADQSGRHCIEIEPYGYRWYRVGGLDYLLRRSDV